MKKYLKLLIFVLTVLALAATCVACGSSSETKVMSIEINAEGLRTQYEVGEQFIPQGVATVKYSDGKEETVDITADMCSAPDMSVAGTKTVYVQYKEGVGSYEITVSEKSNTDNVYIKVVYEDGYYMTYSATKGSTVQLESYVRESDDGRACVGFSINGVTYDITQSVKVDANAEFIAIFEQNALMFSLSYKDEYIVTGLAESCEDTQITIPATHHEKPVIAIDNYAFEGNEKIEKVVIEGDPVIYEGAFMNCVNLKEIDFGKSVYISKDAFANCSSLTAIDLGENLETVEEGAFNGCYSVESVSLYFTGRSAEAQSKTPESVFGYIFGGEKYENSALVASNYGDTMNDVYEFYLPKPLSHITFKGKTVKQGVFSNLGAVEDNKISVVLEGTETVEKMAFEYSLIKHIDFGDKIEYIGDYAAYCSFLETLELPATLQYMGVNAFDYCELTSVEIDENALLTEIPTSAFSRNTEFKEFRVPKNVESIGNSAFMQCEGLQDVTFAGTGLKTIGDNAFQQCALKFFDTPDGTLSIGTQAFYWCTDLRNVFVPDTITTIGSNAFDGSVSISFVCEAASQPAGFAQNWAASTSNENSPKIMWYGKQMKRSGDFLYCAENGEAVITAYFGHGGDVTIPADINGDKVVEIGNYAFYYVNGNNGEAITSLKLGANLRKIGNRSFSYCSDIPELILPDALSEIGEMAFVALSAVRSLYISTNVEVIGERAFGGCFNIIFYCDDVSKPQGWADTWNAAVSGTSVYPTYWNCGNGNSGVYENDFVYVKEGAGESQTITITRYLGLDNIVSIPSEIEGRPVTRLGKDFIANNKLDLMFVPKSVKKFDNAAFSGNLYLVVVVESSEEEINAQSDQNYNTTSRPIYFGLSESDVKVYNGLYYFIDAKTNYATVIRYIGSDSVVAIPSAIHGVYVRTIGSRAFSGADTLKAVYIPSGVTNIGASVFYRCMKYNLTVCMGAESATQYGYDDNWTALSDFAQDKFTPITGITQPISTTGDGFVYYVKDDAAAVIKYVGNSENVIVPDEINGKAVKSLGDYFVYGNTAIKYVQTGNNVVSIGVSAFSLCTNVTKIVITDSVVSIGESAFYNARNAVIYFEYTAIPSGWDMDKINPSGCTYYLGNDWYFDENRVPVLYGTED